MVNTRKSLKANTKYKPWRERKKKKELREKDERRLQIINEHVERVFLHDKDISVEVAKRHYRNLKKIRTKCSSGKHKSLCDKVLKRIQHILKVVGLAEDLYNSQASPCTDLDSDSANQNSEKVVGLQEQPTEIDSAIIDLTEKLNIGASASENVDPFANAGISSSQETYCELVEVQNPTNTQRVSDIDHEIDDDIVFNIDEISEPASNVQNKSTILQQTQHNSEKLSDDNILEIVDVKEPSPGVQKDEIIIHKTPNAQSESIKSKLDDEDKIQVSSSGVKESSENAKKSEDPLERTMVKSQPKAQKASKKTSKGRKTKVLETGSQESSIQDGKQAVDKENSNPESQSSQVASQSWMYSAQVPFNIKQSLVTKLRQKYGPTVANTAKPGRNCWRRGAASALKNSETNRNSQFVSQSVLAPDEQQRAGDPNDGEGNSQIYDDRQVPNSQTGHISRDQECQARRDVNFKKSSQSTLARSGIGSIVRQTPDVKSRNQLDAECDRYDHFYGSSSDRTEMENSQENTNYTFRKSSHREGVDERVQRHSFAPRSSGHGVDKILQVELRKQLDPDDRDDCFSYGSSKRTEIQNSQEKFYHIFRKSSHGEEIDERLQRHSLAPRSSGHGVQKKFQIESRKQWVAEDDRDDCFSYGSSKRTEMQNNQEKSHYTFQKSSHGEEIDERLQRHSLAPRSSEHDVQKKFQIESRKQWVAEDDRDDCFSYGSSKRTEMQNSLENSDYTFGNSSRRQGTDVRLQQPSFAPRNSGQSTQQRLEMESKKQLDEEHDRDDCFSYGSSKRTEMQNSLENSDYTFGNSSHRQGTDVRLQQPNFAPRNSGQSTQQRLEMESKKQLDEEHDRDYCFHDDSFCNRSEMQNKQANSDYTFRNSSHREGIDERLEQSSFAPRYSGQSNQKRLEMKSKKQLDEEHDRDDCFHYDSFCNRSEMQNKQANSDYTFRNSSRREGIDERLQQPSFAPRYSEQSTQKRLGMKSKKQLDEEDYFYYGSSAKRTEMQDSQENSYDSFSQRNFEPTPQKTIGMKSKMQNDKGDDEDSGYFYNGEYSGPSSDQTQMESSQQSFTYRRRNPFYGGTAKEGVRPSNMGTNFKKYSQHSVSQSDSGYYDQETAGTESRNQINTDDYTSEYFGPSSSRSQIQNRQQDSYYRRRKPPPGNDSRNYERLSQRTFVPSVSGYSGREMIGIDSKRQVATDDGDYDLVCNGPVSNRTHAHNSQGCRNFERNDRKTIDFKSRKKFTINDTDEEEDLLFFGKTSSSFTQEQDPQKNTITSYGSLSRNTQNLNFLEKANKKKPGGGISSCDERAISKSSNDDAEAALRKIIKDTSSSTICVDLVLSSLHKEQLSRPIKGTQSYQNERDYSEPTRLLTNRSEQYFNSEPCRRPEADSEVLDFSRRSQSSQKIAERNLNKCLPNKETLWRGQPRAKALGLTQNNQKSFGAKNQMEESCSTFMEYDICTPSDSEENVRDSAKSSLVTNKITENFNEFFNVDIPLFRNPARRDQDDVPEETPARNSEMISGGLSEKKKVFNFNKTLSMQENIRLFRESFRSAVLSQPEDQGPEPERCKTPDPRKALEVAQPYYSFLLPEDCRRPTLFGSPIKKRKLQQ